MFSIESIYKSSISSINEMIADIKSAGLSQNMEYYAWDSRGQESEIPNKDLIGLVGWSYAENEGLPVIQIGILLSLVLDQNMFREVAILDIIRNRFVGPHGDYKTMALRTSDTGAEYSVLQVSDFEIMPSGRSEIRTTRNVGVELIRASGD